MDTGPYLQHQLDGSLSDLRCLTAKTRTMERLIHEALFTDDCALMAHRESQLQLIRNKSAEASRLFSPTIRLGNSEVLHQPAPGITAPAPNVFIGGLQLKVVENFKNLGNEISSDRSLDKEIDKRICKASKALGCLHTKVLNHHCIWLPTKQLVYRAVVLSSLF